jgi:hypothetical protein
MRGSRQQRWTPRRERSLPVIGWCEFFVAHLESKVSEISEIKNCSSYVTKFAKKKPAGKWQEEALKCALDIRKFEIDLYWKRAGYFWTLIAASFVGYFALQNAKPGERNTSAIFIITCIGFILSFAWYLVNKGSKYWQENWERHVDVLAEDVIGPLYRTTLMYERNWKIVFKPRDGFPFSVSRINQVVSSFITILWFLLAIRAFLYSVEIPPPGGRTLATCLMAVFTIIFAVLLPCFGWPTPPKQQRVIEFDIAPFKNGPSPTS